MHPDMLDISVTGNIKSIIASRISYFLDLKGPSLVVDTACSSSLVSIHLAVQSIRNGESDYALAGGVKLTLLPLVGEKTAGIGTTSSDYRTKSFDDSSDGTGGGEGCAVVFKTFK